MEGAEVPIRPETTVLEWEEYLDLLELKIRKMEELEAPEEATRYLETFLDSPGAWGGAIAGESVAAQIRKPAFLAALESRGLARVTFPQQIQDGEVLTGLAARDVIQTELSVCLEMLGDAAIM